MIKNATAACLIFLNSSLYAQSTLEPAADFMRSMGKMYVVLGVIVIIFLGLVYYIWKLDRRLTKLEDQNHH